jgi:predicted transcriptional regulator
MEAKKTQIMFKANLSYKALTKYLCEVLNAELVSYVEDRQIYKLTEKGHNFLLTYRIYSKSNKHLEKRKNHLNSTKRMLDNLCPTSPSLLDPQANSHLN